MPDEGKRAWALAGLASHLLQGVREVALLSFSGEYVNSITSRVK